MCHCHFAGGGCNQYPGIYIFIVFFLQYRGFVGVHACTVHKTKDLFPELSLIVNAIYTTVQKV